MMYHAALTLHIIGIVLLAGSIFMDFFFTWQFWKMDNLNVDSRASVVMMIEKVRKLMGAGGLLAILSGVWMVSLVPAWAEQPWFHLKMGILIVVLFNALFFRRRLGRSLSAMAQGRAGDEKPTKWRGRLSALQWIQMLLLISMFVLSVFKFN